MSLLRAKDTAPEAFRAHCHSLTTLLAIEATQGLRTRQSTVETPLEVAETTSLDQSLVVVPILRAGLGMLESFTGLFPSVSVGYVGLERDHQTAIASCYYNKLPPLNGKLTLVIDPMLATGGSASMCIKAAKDEGADQVAMVCIVAVPEGVEVLKNDHPDVEIFAAALDRELNDKKYILPGLGDFGDRLYGTV